jgi:type IX secretion system PorP/SprF family membrane protein
MIKQGFSSWFIKPIAIAGLLVSFFGMKGWAQDPHFTQFYMSPHTLNPAMVGAFQGTLKAGGIYRNQWQSISPNNFRTFTGFASRKFPVGADYVTIGILGTNDQSGPGNFEYTQAVLSGAYHKKMGKHVLRGGLQAGLINNAIGDVTFPAQYDHDIGGFDPDLPTQEGQIARNTSYFDLNAGLAWQVQLADWHFTIGQAMYHANQPNASLIRGEEWQLTPRLVSHAQANIPLSGKTGLEPALRFQTQGKATELMLGSMVRFGKPEQTLILKAGSFYRNNLTGAQSQDLVENVDAVSLNAGAIFKSFELGLAYDLNLSDLEQATNYRGAFEVALTYTYGFTEQPEKQTIPCYRY